MNCYTECDRQAARFIIREWQTAIDKKRATTLYQIHQDSLCMSGSLLCTKYDLDPRIKKALRQHNATQLVSYTIDQMNSFGF
jgi:hypothetical protein